ncbi:MAG: TetR/AcrR family transcriptional regulator [Oscillospiraceae bacterium]|nr:TetR/AcrR family transcriptional regulator [Oscillospiraceae bacterium]
MDRRQQKTRKAIFEAFSALLEQKRFEHITVQDIIDRANVGRSTFYAHFETKDSLVKAMCADIFDHIFESAACAYSHRGNSLEAELCHVLCHLRDSKKDVVGILSSQSGDLFMQYYREYLAALFARHRELFPANVPHDFALNHLSRSFAAATAWWVDGKMEHSPERLVDHFLAMTGEYTPCK